MPLEFSNCSNPWASMLIYPDNGGEFAPCCHFCPPGSAFPFVMSDGMTIEQIWNSQPYADLRKSIGLRTPVFSSCINCQTLRYESRFSPDLNALISRFSSIPAQMENLHNAMRHFKSKDMIVSSSPVGYLMRFGYACNIQCIMCNHRKMIQAQPLELDFEWLKQQEDSFKRACYITVTGGEPFFISTARKFIYWVLENDSLKDVILGICTNGLLLDEFIPKISNRKIHLDISIDSFGELYNQIRRGSSWEKVSSNIDAFLSHNPNNTPNNQRVTIHCTIIRTGLPGLPDLVRWCIERKLPIHFALMENYSGIEKAIGETECLSLFPDNLRCIPHWERYFDESITLIEEAARKDGEGYRKTESSQLELLRQKLSDALYHMPEQSWRRKMWSSLKRSIKNAFNEI